MDKLSDFNRFLSFINRFFLPVFFGTVFAESNFSTLFSSNDPFYKITLYRENYILPYHHLREIVIAKPISVDWIQPIMNIRVENRGNLDLKKGKVTPLTLRIGRKKTVKALSRKHTLQKKLRSKSAQQNIAKRHGIVFIDPKMIPSIPPTPQQTSPLKHFSFQSNYFSPGIVMSPESLQRPFNSIQNTPITPVQKLGVLSEKSASPLNNPEQAPINPISCVNNPLEEKLKKIAMHMNTYAKLESHANAKNTAKKEQKMQKVLNKLAHVIADRPYYDYMVEEEVAFQISLKIPLFYFKKTDTRFYAAYTQRSWWQTKTSISAFFRETNFMPEFFIEQPFSSKIGRFVRIESIKAGGIHQSNGEGLEWERSWNRLFLELCLKFGPFQLTLEPWLVLPTKDKATYNPDIEEHLGIWQTRLSLRHKLCQCTVQVQKSACQVLGSIPILPSLNLTVFYFSGKGSTLSLYKEQNSSWGIGIGAKV